jgi:hypothetical protein
MGKIAIQLVLKERQDVKQKALSLESAFILLGSIS